MKIVKILRNCYLRGIPYSHTHRHNKQTVPVSCAPKFTRSSTSGRARHAHRSGRGWSSRIDTCKKGSSEVKSELSGGSENAPFLASHHQVSMKIISSLSLYSDTLMLAILGYPHVYIIYIYITIIYNYRDTVYPVVSYFWTSIWPRLNETVSISSSAGPSRVHTSPSAHCRRSPSWLVAGHSLLSQRRQTCHLTNPRELEKGCHMLAPSNNHYIYLYMIITCIYRFCWIGCFEHHWTVHLILTVSHPNHDLSSHKGCCWCPTHFSCFTFHRKPVDLVAFHTQNLPITLPKPLRRAIAKIAKIAYKAKPLCPATPDGPKSLAAEVPVLPSGEVFAKRKRHAVEHKERIPSKAIFQVDVWIQQR